MNSRSTVFFTCFLAFAGSCTSAGDLSKELQPFFSMYCLSCHGSAKQKADFRVDTLDDDLIGGSDADHWQEVLDLVQLGEMPPGDAPKNPSRRERRKVVNLLSTAIREAAEAQRSTGGRNVLRRLTAYEYNNTVRDLLGLDLNYAIDLPPEGAAQEGPSTCKNIAAREKT